MDNIKIGDVVTFCKQPEAFMHSALVIELGKNGMVNLVHVVTLPHRSLPQVEVNVPWQKPDEDGRYYIIIEGGK